MSGKLTEAWFGAEGEREEMPMLSRGRNPDHIWMLRQAFPHLLCIDWFYEVTDESGLPSEKDYADRSAFEEAAFDTLDDKGILVFARTWSGSVRYILYVRDQDEAAAYIEQHIRDDQRVEFSTTEDPEWAEYREILAQHGLAPPST